MDKALQNILTEVKSYDPKSDLKLIQKAYERSKDAHSGQKRMSGHDYIDHPVEVVNILLEFKPDIPTICAALLHDVIEESPYNLKDIEKEFGTEIASLVEGETKTTKVNFDSPEAYTAENWRKILLATTKDVRVILIKLADRLNNMRTLKHLREDKQKRISKETMEIYAPIAHKLGLYSIKGELEDLSLRYLKPDIYQYLKKRINEKRENREDKAEMILGLVKKNLEEKKIEYFEVSGRAKYFFSIYKKMISDKKSFDEIYDLIAIRIIVKSIPDCYRVLAEIHQLWKPIPGRFKDYVAVPKSNGYQSLHTDVATPFDVVLEVQIRTVDMHYVAKYGVAAHWRYKGTDRDKKFDKRISWLEQVLDWKRKAPGEFLDTLRVDLFRDEIVVFSPKGDPIILPEESTPLDFAYEIHTKIGDSCSKARVNKKLVALDYKLKSGDVIHIITSPNSKPSRSWLSFVVSSKAKQKIRSSLGIESDIDPKQVRQKKDKINLAKYIAFEGKKAQLKLSKCCNPKFEDKIVAYKMKEGTITVHKTNCPNIHTMGKSRKIKVSWNVPQKDIRKINVYVEDKLAMVEQILNSLLKFNINVLSINLKPHKRSILITLKIKINSETDVKKTVEILKTLEHVNYIDVQKIK
ncbi:bifunctional (p)ppGpp synthetase/guanosine-3',5'-bis(diphosphate) 3'-pyrophosphohydrolase [archaeon]|jgi:GTP diphosphokinase / guanosine-3',5'-bis(diphosphate) 3'-diphosphatase|nr:bifunctional (p)ppGpp synthetase/guanosine-3',5'-bis(diphosphate) 3'-pyrophosphohydrolase [archaeon]MBT4021865.1 bifunctional (p)ppGpp synthetase/guanosine-3',5'-bis(diphosphate) 3'-pyrophosphohydrolase [archaeon]MBT4272160.1 bifunctional (p)ppGpp synthetase/guanosine-3',5'-bis(diphosphate) 3'-pyrophosphohydrolase [archaeon]MBT4460341.1 bifunctional (p)ppGpp synthetase/guanosine-3',5'-bis(diphosphate) 3'-pyrophosphohydrolase [archaeon]MBT4858965.1 bifunctional (p)ppGpp synthetase/guanosine-3